ncbi:DUF1294 domain-containing protein [Verrucomicrobium sp. BvORR106]|uniref:DUF1294 domain-containing protein n=1 Tax=Verrucomicrobium sp. BvORR106 TaxID=1403819 RepID=UPI00056E7825|nr:DUF1294 domain-containing protein [Verrucomicrobium sp. BvORR106]
MPSLPTSPLTPRQWGLFAALLVPPVLTLVLATPRPWVAVSYFLTMSVASYGLYAYDKQRAQTGKWRIPESRLHLFSLLGGWPGAYLAQRRFRHKTAKTLFQAVFWIIVAGYQLVSVDGLLGWPLLGGVGK